MRFLEGMDRETRKNKSEFICDKRTRNSLLFGMAAILEVCYSTSPLELILQLRSGSSD